MVADQTNYFDAEKSVFKLGAGATNLTAYVKEVRGLPGQVKMNDITVFGSVGERPGPSIYVAHFSVEFLFNMITTSGVWAIISPMYTGKTLTAFEFYPAGETVGNVKISGNAYLAVLEITSRVGDYVSVHAEFHTDNGVTVGVKA